MSSTKIWLSVLLIVLLGLTMFSVGASESASIAFSELPKNTPDGRFGTRCHPWARDSSREMCEVSFYRLLAQPEQYDKRIIKISGLLKKEFGRVVLFPSEASYQANVEGEGIELTDSSAIPKDMESRLGAGIFPVTIIGQFDGKYIGPNITRLGLLREIFTVYEAKRLAGGD